MHLLILGANSDVAHAVARKFAKEERAHLYLASRDMEILGKRAQDIAARCQVHAESLYFDASDYDSHPNFYDKLNPKPDGVIVAFGYLGNQKQAQTDFQEASKIIQTNYLGAVSILEIIAADFEKRGHGFIIGISSVAGLRGRQSNYTYGSAKGALTVYLSGLRNRLYKKNIPVITILPGFIRTKMIEGLPTSPLLTSDPNNVARDIYKAFANKKDIVFTGWHWKWIMMIIAMLPEYIFKRISL